jgi:thermitase
VVPGTEQETVGRLTARPDVVWAQPNYLRRAAAVVNDPRFGEQWALPHIQVPEAWDASMGASFVVVAVIDTGVDLDHPDLQDRLLPGYNFLDPDSPPRDDAGHGTHAAGIIAATANNMVGIAGVAPETMIMPLKALDREGVGRDSVAAEAIHYAVDEGAWVVNMSFDGRTRSRALEEAVAYATERGVVLVVAAGNEGVQEPAYPGANKPAIAVAAIDRADRRSFYSNFGDWIDVSAPGQSVLSTSWAPSVGSIYRIETGTSSSAPLVAGVVALMFSVQPLLSVEEIVAALQSTADPLVDAGTGAGRVNAIRALSAVSPIEIPIPTPVELTPTPTELPTATPTPPSSATPVPSTRTPTGTPTVGLPVLGTPTGVLPPPSPPGAVATQSATPSATATTIVIRLTPLR